MEIQARRVEIRQAGRSIAVPDGRTILETALDAGIAYPHGCRSGRCGSCKSRLVAGEVDLLDHTRFALSQEKVQGLILACRALPKSDAAIAWLGGDEERADHPRRRLRCRVVGLEDATHDIKRVRLAIDGGGTFMFTAGQYAHVTSRVRRPATIRWRTGRANLNSNFISATFRAASPAGASRLR